MKKTLTLLILSTLIGLSTFAYFPNRKNTITLVNNGTALTDYKLLIVFDGASYIPANLKANFDDVRFSSEPTCPTTFINHYVERVQGTTATMWVDLATFPVGTTKIYMYFGDATATHTNDIYSVFPNVYIAPTSVLDTLTGIQNYDWFEVPSTSTVTVLQGESLIVNASRIKISGNISVIGKGYQKGSFNSIGGGPGGGTFSPNPENSGAGGGSYAGVGGTGGYDQGDNPGVGGAAYGTPNGTAIDFGSAGGSSINTLGGNGGGAVSLTAKVLVTISPATVSPATPAGAINVSGENAASPSVSSSMGGGGGAGGTIFIKGDWIEATGGASLTAAGGAGTDFPNMPTAVKDGGGGGGGGRIKYYYGTDLNTMGVFALTGGGVGGKNGDIIGANGAVGSVSSLQTAPYANYTSSFVVNYIPCFPLPVSILSFEANKVGNEVKLAWVTENEKNASHFEIQHSTDAINFLNIGGVTALNGALKNSYEFPHKNPASGVNYYRIKQIDIDGKYAFTMIRNIMFGQAEDVIIYPNPASDVLSVSINNFKKATEAKLINQFGQVVKSQLITKANIELNIQDLPIGVYYFEYNTNRIKFTKQ
jgi:hypothetical protein